MKNLSSLLLIYGWRLKTIIFLLIFFILDFSNKTILAANSLDVVINEIAWMGTEISYNNEWIELYNNTNSAINLSDWKLVSQDGIPEINLTGIIPANSFYLLERTNDDTVPDITSDQIYTGAMGNNGENLALYDNFGNLIDSVTCSSGWFAGDNQTKQTMARKSGIEQGSDSLNWMTSRNPGGTPKTSNEQIENSQSLKSESKEPQALIKPEGYPSGIFINEILPSPIGPDEEEEWIEIFNQNQEGVDLFNWEITDNVGSIITYTCPQETKIPPQGFLVLSRQITKITLNNDGDGVSLIQPDGNIIETINFPKAPLGQSYNRTSPNSGAPSWVWSTVLTPGALNEISAPASEIKKVANSLEEVKKPVLKDKSEKEEDSPKETAAISGQISPKSSNFFFILLIASVVATFSGIIILFLKRKFKKFDLKIKME